MSTTALPWTLLGVLVGILVCHGREGASQVVAAMRWAEGSMPKRFLRDSATGFAGIALSAMLTVAMGLTSARAEGPELGPGFKAAVLTILYCGFLVNLNSVPFSAHESKAGNGYLGPLRPQLMGAATYHSTSLRAASIHMCCVYGALIGAYTLLFYGCVSCYHMDPVRQRPINTIRYIEWSFSVPTLMWVLGRDLLELPCHQVLVPIIHTLVYIWLAWAGQLVAWTWARAAVISAALTIVVEANIAQQRWHKRGHPLKSLALGFQMVFFAMYGVVYLIALADMVTPVTEDVLYTCFDITTKLGHTALIVLMGRRSEVDRLVHVVQSYLDVMSELGSLAGAQFDLLIHCRNSPHGLLISGNCSALERCVGRDLKDQPLSEICFSKADRQRLQRHSLSRPPPSSAGEQSEVADVLRVDLHWAGSPSGSMPAELFTAKTATALGAAGGGVVLVGVRFQNRCPLPQSAHPRKLFSADSQKEVATVPPPPLKVTTAMPQLRDRPHSDPGPQRAARGGRWKQAQPNSLKPAAATAAAPQPAARPICAGAGGRLAAGGGPGPDWGKVPLLSESDVKLMEVLGHGSLGKVRKVRWRGEAYAQKVLENAQWNPKKRGVWYKVRQEASVLSGSSRTAHPHLCRLVGVVTSPRISFLFELCSGGSMHSRLLARQPVTWAQRLAILEQTASAIKHLHDFRIIHRDLKSSNILLLSPVTPEVLPHVKVTDVGFTRWFEPIDSYDGGSGGRDSSGAYGGGGSVVPGGPPGVAASMMAEEGRGGCPRVAGLASGLPGLGGLHVPHPASNSGRRRNTTPGSLAAAGSGGGGCGRGGGCRAPELRTGIYGSAVDVYALGVFLLQLSAWTSSLPRAWRDLLSSFPRPQGVEEITRLAEASLADEAARRPTALDVLRGAQELDASEVEQFGILWAVHVACAGVDDV